MAVTGALIIVGTGLKLGAHLTAETRGQLRAADIVFAAVPTPGGIPWLRSLAREVVDLGAHYVAGRARHEIYDGMVEAILGEVRADRRVCAAFYGHPGVFVSPAHRAIAIARAEGYEARMLPGISAEDCLFADLGVDPVENGCQSYEATAFLMQEQTINPSAPLILWQIGVVGEGGICRGPKDPRALEALITVLRSSYPGSHPVTVYTAALTAVHDPLIEVLPLESLGAARLDEMSTLFVPPARPPRSRSGLPFGPPDDPST